MPWLSRTLFSISSLIVGLSLKNCLAFSLPWPIFSPLYEYQAPLLSTIPISDAKSSISAYLETPCPYIISTDAVLNGGATLFFTILTLVLLPITLSPFLICSPRLTYNIIVE